MCACAWRSWLALAAHPTMTSGNACAPVASNHPQPHHTHPTALATAPTLRSTCPSAACATSSPSRSSWRTATTRRCWRRARWRRCSRCPAPAPAGCSRTSRSGEAGGGAIKGGRRRRGEEVVGGGVGRRWEGGRGREEGEGEKRGVRVRQGSVRRVGRWAIGQWPGEWRREVEGCVEDEAGLGELSRK